MKACISIHALLAESDCFVGASQSAIAGFLSTLSLRRATPTAGILGFNPLISIHALLAESDIDKIPNQCKIDKFLSTLSLRRATKIPR